MKKNSYQSKIYEDIVSYSLGLLKKYMLQVMQEICSVPD